MGGCIYRVVDFTLSSLVNGGLQHIYVLTQYKSHSLNKHITITWRLSNLLDNYVTPVPAQQRLGPRWQAGYEADALYESLNLIHADRPNVVVVVGADHVYRMDPSQIIEAHLAWVRGSPSRRSPSRERRRRTSASCRTHRMATSSRSSWKSRLIHRAVPRRPDEALVSMGNYVFDTGVLVDALHKDAADESSGHSIGGDIIPRLVTGAHRARL